MALFLSTTLNKIDSKSRVSVPANFRTSLSDQSFKGIIAFPSYSNQCIDSCGIDRMEEIAEQFKDMTRNLASAGTETAGKSEEGAAAMDPLAAADKQEAGAKEDAKKSEQSGSIAG